jgi:hypothetical protein
MSSSPVEAGCSERFAKEQEDKHMIHFADGDEPRDSKTTVLARLAPASTTNTPAASESTCYPAGPGIALIAVARHIHHPVIDL